MFESFDVIVVESIVFKLRELFDLYIIEFCEWKFCDSIIIESDLVSLNELF
jgi:hypothetical protein